MDDLTSATDLACSGAMNFLLTVEKSFFMLNLVLFLCW